MGDDPNISGFAWLEGSISIDTRCAEKSSCVGGTYDSFPRMRPSDACYRHYTSTKANRTLIWNVSEKNEVEAEALMMESF